MTAQRPAADAAPVNSSQRATGLLIDSASELLFEIYLMRGDCSRAAEFLLRQQKIDREALELCARLDDSLAQNFRLLQATLARLRQSRANSPETVD